MHGAPDWGWVEVLHPTHRDEAAMHGAPERFGLIEENEQRRQPMQRFWLLQNDGPCKRITTLTV
jgi:hypothetical protein